MQWMYVTLTTAAVALAAAAVALATAAVALNPAAAAVALAAATLTKPAATLAQPAAANDLCMRRRHHELREVRCFDRHVDAHCTFAVEGFRPVCMHDGWLPLCTRLRQP